MICKKCGKEKDLSCFHKNGKYYRKECKQCRSVASFPKVKENKKKLDFSVKLSIINSIKTNKSGRKWEDFLEFSLDDLKKHLEENFDGKMTWGNYGTYWGITTIIPKRYFISVREIKNCWSLKNIIPKTIDQCKKNNKLPHLEEIKKYNLFDILPVGINLTKELIDDNL